MSGGPSKATGRERVPPGPLEALNAVDRPGLLPPYPFPVPRGRTRERTARLLRRVEGTSLPTPDALRELGMLSLAVPEDQGGLGLELPGELRLLREVARHDAGAALAVGAHGTVVARALSASADRGTARAWLRRMASGSVLATHGLWDERPQRVAAGPDRSMPTYPVVAHRSEDGEGWGLQGAVPSVVSATHAQLFLIPARLVSGPDASPGAGAGRRLFLVEAADGVSVARPPGDDPRPLGLARAGVAELRLTRVVADLAAHLGAIDDPEADHRAEAATDQARIRALLSTASVALGLGERLLLLACAPGNDGDPGGDVRGRIAEAASVVRALDATVDLAAHAQDVEPLRPSALVDALVCGVLGHDVLAETTGLIAAMAGASATIDRSPTLVAILDAVALAGFPASTGALEDELGDALGVLLDVRTRSRRSSAPPRPARPTGLFGILGGGRRGDLWTPGLREVDPTSGAAVAAWLLAEARDLVLREPSPEGRARRRRIAQVATSFQALGALMGQTMERSERLGGDRSAPDRASARTYARRAVAGWRAAGLGPSVPEPALTTAVEDAGRIVRQLGDRSRGYPADRAGWG